MILSGWMLWDEGGSRSCAVSGTPAGGGSAPTWVEGTWEVAGGHLHRLHRLTGGSARGTADLQGWFLPGPVDVHCHIGIGAEGPADRDEQERQALADRDSGVLAVRDCGVPVDNSWVQSRPDLPRLIRAGRHVARPKRYIRGLAIELEDPGDLPAELARQARAGDGWVKIVGDWIDRAAGADADLEPLWPLEVLRDGVDAAHAEGARVAVHCFSHAAVDDLLEAGVDDIEHGSGMDDDQLAEAASRGVTVTPTLQQVELFGGFAEAAGRRYPRYAATMRALFEGRHDHAERLFDSGVHLLPGTDAGGYQEHGTLAAELALWGRAGADPARVVDLATWRARDVLGLESLGEGTRADLVVLDADPRKGVDVLVHPAAVILGGAVVARRQVP